jgi:hypothetical protein
VAELGVRRVAGPVAAAHAELFGLPEYPSAGAGLAPSPAGLVAAAGEQLRAGQPPAPLEPYYLRRPDAVPPGERKRAVPASERDLAGKRDGAGKRDLAGKRDGAGERERISLG